MMKDIKIILDTFFRDSNSIKINTKIDELSNIKNQRNSNYSQLEFIVLKYYELVTLEELSELDAKYLEKILEQAETNETLSLLLNEIDELTFQELDFYDPSNLEQVEYQKIKVKNKKFISNSKHKLEVDYNLSIQSISDHQGIITEYHKLKTLGELSELEAKRLDEILKFAETNEIISLLLNEVDEMTFQELGFYNNTNTKTNEFLNSLLLLLSFLFLLNEVDEITFQELDPYDNTNSEYEVTLSNNDIFELDSFFLPISPELVEDTQDDNSGSEPNTFTNVFDDDLLTPRSDIVGLEKFDSTEFNPFCIEWEESQVVGKINDTSISEELVTLPSEDMGVFLNTRANGFAEAIDDSLIPSDSLLSNQTFFYDIGYVQVETLI